MYSYSSLEIPQPSVQSIEPSAPLPHQLDAETYDQVFRGRNTVRPVNDNNSANKHLSEYLHLLTNEPSIGLFHIEEHIRKAVPKLVRLSAVMHYCSNLQYKH